MIHVYYARAGAESADNLFKRIKETVGETNVLIHSQHDKDFQKKPGDLVVNWGASTARKFGDKCAWLNKGVYFDKLDHIRRMAQAGVPTVEVAFDNKAPGKWLGRRRSHIDGDDLIAALSTPDYYVRWVDIQDEYRAHVFRGEVLRVSHKRPSTKFLEKGETINQEYRVGNGWVFSDENFLNQVGPRMRRAAVEAVVAVGYDFGGVDVAYLKGGEPIVFEVNSAPWLGGEMQRAYSDRIVRIARG